MQQPPKGLIESLNDGKIFHVRFLKRSDHSERDMLARRGVVKRIVGTGQPYDAQARGLLTVWDIDNQAYRNVPLDSIVFLKHHKKVWRPMI